MLLKSNFLSVSVAQGRHLADGRGTPFNSEIGNKSTCAALSRQSHKSLDLVTAVEI
jgi:hypothetical protein